MFKEEVSQSKYTRHEALCQLLTNTYCKKNEAYGDAFGKTFQELGIISAITRMTDKFNRIKALALGADNKVADESIKDSLLDLANYCLMTYIELEMMNGLKD
jgi:hypothetical protein